VKVTDEEILYNVAVAKYCSSLDDIKKHTGASNGRECLTKCLSKPFDRHLCICYITAILNIGLFWGTDYFMVPMRNDKEKIIKNMQNNLRLVRHAAGWSAQELGELIGVTRQTINNIENHKTPLSATQYVALCAMLKSQT